jgi:hypothetical protein
LNVQGTLLDCSSLTKRNPNPGIKPSSRIAGRRFFFWPLMVDFLCNCFQHFQVAFRGSKNTAYMQDVVPVMLGKLKGDKESVPSFVWSGQAYEPFVWFAHNHDHIETRDVEGILWRKRLERVYKTWPFWNASNTLIVDHNMSRVACNLKSNIILILPFYVEKLEKLEDDNNYLNSAVWPMLEAFVNFVDIEDFRCTFPHSVPEPENPKKAELERVLANDIQTFMAGEGTNGPSGSYCKLFPHLAFELLPNSCNCVCREHWISGRQGRRRWRRWKPRVTINRSSRYDASVTVGIH